MASNGIKALLFWVLSVSSFSLVLSCKNSGDNVALKDARKIAEMTCASRKLTNEKFVLASRYAEIEQLEIENKIKPDSAAQIRRKYDKEKVMLVQKAQAQSDELLQFLRVAWKERYPTQAERAMLDSLTAIEMRSVCNLL